MYRSVVLMVLMLGVVVCVEAQDQKGSRSPDLVAIVDNPRLETAETQPTAAKPQDTSDSAKRKGFIVGLGGGVAFKRESVVAVINRTTQVVTSSMTGALTDFKIGYAPNDQVLVYYTNQVAWGENAGYDAIGMSAVGVTYMLKPTTRTLFLTGAAGASLGRNVVGTSSNNIGLGVSVGGGYEFARHFSVGGRWMSLDVGHTKRSNVFGFTFDWMFY